MQVLEHHQVPCVHGRPFGLAHSRLPGRTRRRPPDFSRRGSRGRRRVVPPACASCISPQRRSCRSVARMPKPRVLPPRRRSVAACAPSARSSFGLRAACPSGSGGVPSAFGRAAAAMSSSSRVARAPVDVGPGAFVRLGEMHIHLDRIDTVLLAHLHIDHSGDLPARLSRAISPTTNRSSSDFGTSGGGDYRSTTASSISCSGRRALRVSGEFGTHSSSTRRLRSRRTRSTREVLREADLRVTSNSRSITATPAAVAVPHRARRPRPADLRRPGVEEARTWGASPRGPIARLRHVGPGSSGLTASARRHGHTAPRRIGESRREGRREVASPEPHPPGRREVRGRRPRLRARKAPGADAIRERLPARRPREVSVRHRASSRAAASTISVRGHFRGGDCLGRRCRSAEPESSRGASSCGPTQAPSRPQTLQCQ